MDEQLRRCQELAERAIGVWVLVEHGDHNGTPCASVITDGKDEACAWIHHPKALPAMEAALRALAGEPAVSVLSDDERRYLERSLVDAPLNVARILDRLQGKTP